MLQTKASAISATVLLCLLLLFTNASFVSASDPSEEQREEYYARLVEAAEEIKVEEVEVEVEEEEEEEEWFGLEGEPGSNQFLTDIIVDVIGKTNLTGIGLDLSNMTLEGIMLDPVTLEDFHIGVAIMSPEIALPVVAHSIDIDFNCSLNFNLLEIGATLNSEVIPLNCLIPADAPQMTIGISTEQTSMDVAMNISKFHLNAAMEIDSMPMIIDMHDAASSISLSINKIGSSDVASWVVLFLLFFIMGCFFLLHLYHRHTSSKLLHTLQAVPDRNVLRSFSKCETCAVMNPPRANYCGGCGFSMPSQL